ncbi:MAG: VOC family protein [Bacteroidota bacterium]
MIDHLVYLVHDLEGRAAQIGAALGVSFTTGGRHLDRGTRNSLLRLGDRTYLELLAVDPNNTDIKPPRWMGIDLLPPNSQGKLSRWALHAGAEIGPSARALAEVAPAAGEVQPGSRALPAGGTLRWQLTNPLSEPLVRSLPFLLDWQGGITPPEMLPDVGCSLRELRVTTPHTKIVRSLAEADDPLVLLRGEAALAAVIDGPGGYITLA